MSVRVLACLENEVKVCTFPRASTRGLPKPPHWSRHAPGVGEKFPVGVGGAGVGGWLPAKILANLASVAATRLLKSSKLRKAIGNQLRSDMAGALARIPAIMASGVMPHAHICTPPTDGRRGSGSSHQLSYPL